MKRLMTRLIAMLMTVCMVMGVLCCEAWAAGNSFNDADPISTGYTYTDNLTSSSDKNYYKFTVSSAGYATFSFKHEYVDSSSDYWEMYLYNAGCNQMTGWSYAGNTAATITSAKIALSAGTYYLKVNKYQYSDVTYDITVNFTTSSTWESEFNNSFNDYNYIKTNTTMHGSLMYNGDQDFYKFTVADAGYATFSFKHEYVDSSSDYWEMHLYNADCNQMTGWSYAGNTAATITSAKIALSAGTYYLKVNKYQYSDVTYDITVNFTTSSTWESEFNNSFNDYNYIKTNTTMHGSLMYNGDQDFYKFTIPDAGNVALYFKHEYVDSSSDYWEMHLYDANCEEIMSWNYAGNESTASTTSKTKLPAGTYYLKVNKYQYSDAPYTFKVKYKIPDTPKPTIVCRVSDGKPQLKWNAGTDSTKYEIWRATSSGGTYTKMYTTSKTSYTNTSAKAGYTYYYKVRGVNSNGVAGSFSAVKSITCDCAKPVVSIKCSATSGKPMLSWNAVNGATSYVVYRATSKSGTYTKMYTTTKTSYTNTSAVAGRTYYYKVKAICSKSSYAASAYSNIKSITCDCARPVVSVTTSSGHPKLSWNAVKGATGYVVYRATSSSGSYSKMIKTTKTSYINTSAVAGKTYYYKVKAVSSKSSYATSAYSTVKSIRAK